MYEKLEKLSLAILDAEGNRRGSRVVMAFLLLSACVLSVPLALGPYPITLFPVDAIHPLLQGDYFVKGYRPYVDFYSLHGPFAFQFMTPGVELYGISWKAVVLGQVLAAALFGLLMFKVAASRLHGFWAVVLAISTELLLISCTPLGRRSWREFTPAMWYNSLCFCLTAIVFLYVLAPSRSKHAASRWVDCVIVAFCMMATFHTKMSFFPPIVIVFVIGTIVWPRGAGMRLEGVAALGLTAALIPAFMWSLGGSLEGYIAFLRSVKLSIHPLSYALRFVHHTRTLGVFLVGMLLAGWVAYDVRLLRETRREWLLALLMTGAWLVMAGTCKQDPESLPLIGVIPLAVTVVIVGLAQQAKRPINAKLAASVLLIALVMSTHDAKNGALSWMFSQMTIKTLEPPVERFPNAAYAAKDLVSDRVDPALFALMPKAWVDTTFAGLSLLEEAKAGPGEILCVAATSNDITIMTELNHARGESPWSPAPAADGPSHVRLMNEDFLSDADWILRDMKNPVVWRFIDYHRGKYIEENFVPVGSNDSWTLYKRKGPRRKSAGAEGALDPEAKHRIDLGEA